MQYVLLCLLYARILILLSVKTTENNIDDMRGKEIIQTILIALFLFVTQTAWAQLEVGETYSDEKFKYKCLSDGTVEIIEYIGTATEVTLPYYILVRYKTGYGYASHAVSSLAAGVFEGNTTITSVNMAVGPYNIGDRAFYGCSNLKSIEFPPYLTSFGKEVLAYCNSLETISLYSGSLTGSGTTALGTDHGILYFTNDEGRPVEILACAPLGLTEGRGNITDKNAVKRINAGAFEGCQTLTEIANYPLLEEIGFNAFKDCTSLGTCEVLAGANLKSIGVSCFENCSKRGFAVKVYENSLIEMVPERAFYGCKFLWEMPVFPNATSIGVSAFQSCANIKTANFEAMTKLSKIGDYAFHAYRPESTTGGLMSNIKFPSSLKTIGDYAFWDCEQLGEVKFADNSQLKTIGISAFRGCSTINRNSDGIGTIHPLKMVLPESLQYIGDGAFSESYFYTHEEDGEKYIYIPKNVTVIGNAVFGMHYPTINKFVVDSENPNYTAEDGVLFSKDMTRLLSYPMSKGDINDDGSDIVGYIVPPSVGRIDADAFYAASLIHIVLPSKLGYIDSGTFAQCYHLKDITIPATVKQIGNGAFYACTKLKNMFFMPKTPPSFATGSEQSIANQEEYTHDHPFPNMSDCELHTQCYSGSQYNYVADESNPTSYYDWKYKELGVVNTDTETGRPFTSVSYNYYFTMPESGYMTVARDFDIKFHDESASDLTSYAVSSFDPTTGTVTLTKFTVNTPQLQTATNSRYVPARLLDENGYYNLYFGVIVKGTPGKKYRYILTRNDYTTAAEERMSLPSTYRNLVYPNLVETYREPEYQDTYKFVLNGGKIRRVTKAGILGYNKAYLRLPKSQVEQMYANGLGAKGLNVVFEDGETTTIEYAKTNIASKEDNNYYNLSGQCVENPTKGIYIKNGKKIVIK